MTSERVVDDRPLALLPYEYKDTTRRQSQSYASCALIRIDTKNIIFSYYVWSFIRKAYFEMNRDAVEVLIFKSNKVISVKKGFATSCSFNRLFRKLYEK